MHLQLFAEDPETPTGAPPAAPELSPEKPPRKPRTPRAAKVDVPGAKGGKKPLPKKKGKRIEIKYTAQQIAQQYEGLHMMAATLTQDPALMVQHEAAEAVGQAAYNVIETYDMWWLFAQLPIVELVAAVGVAEAPVIMHLMAKRKARKAGGKQSQEGADQDEPGRAGDVPPALTLPAGS